MQWGDVGLFTCIGSQPKAHDREQTPDAVEDPRCGYAASTPIMPPTTFSTAAFAAPSRSSNGRRT
jgi:hypothetical protein